MIVMKFGGSSVESAEAIQRVAGIVRERLEQRPVVVVSAMGKTTNRLLEIAQTAAKGESAALSLLGTLLDFHLHEAAPLGAEEGLSATFQELKELIQTLLALRELTPRLTDAISAYGERLSSMIVAGAFRRLGVPASHHDTRRLIRTDARHTQAAPLLALTYKFL
jgi:aspartate kinase